MKTLLIILFVTPVVWVFMTLYLGIGIGLRKLVEDEIPEWHRLPRGYYSDPPTTALYDFLLVGWPVLLPFVVAKWFEKKLMKKVQHEEEE